MKKKGKNIKLIYISTDQVYGNDPNKSETNFNINPINQYGKTKYKAELKVRTYCQDAIIIRTNIFGWNINPNKSSFAEWVYAALKNKNKI